MAGSSDPTAYNPNLELTLQPEQNTLSAFFHTTYAATDALDVYLEGNFSENDVCSTACPPSS